MGGWENKNNSSLATFIILVLGEKRQGEYWPDILASSINNDLIIKDLLSNRV